LKRIILFCVVFFLLIGSTFGCGKPKTQAEQLIGTWIGSAKEYGNIELDKNGNFKMFDDSTEIKGKYSLPANNKFTITIQDQPSTFDITLDGNIFKIIFPQQEGQAAQPPMEFKRATAKDLADIKQKRDAANKAKEEATKNLDEGKKLSQENYAVFETTLGTFKLELYFDVAPKTVTNFVNLINKGFYNNVIFHRVINDFMIQTGGFTADGKAKDVGYKFDDEINAKSLGLAAEVIQQYTQAGYVYSDTLKSMKLDYGVLAMANAGPNTNGSQIFIITKKDGVNYQDSKPWLIGKHTGFGKVVSGMDVVLKIQKVPTDSTQTGSDPNAQKQDKPLTNVVITKAYLEPKNK
jgi:cyclophilin family peptidyl-prolyl cis-trans isomerase